MRIAYIGLSTPLMYDYKAPAPKGPADVHTSPNPILDCPTGLMLLFDELWFLTRSLCPKNLRTVPWVKFLDEIGLPPSISSLNPTDFTVDWSDRPELQTKYKRVRSVLEQYDQVRQDLGIYWGGGQDNHTHGLNIGGLQVSANSIRLDNLLMDLEIVRRLCNDSVELVTNRFGQNWLDEVNPSIRESALAQVLIIDRIPSYLTAEGPYHPLMEEARDNRYLKDFRRWITETASTTDPKELNDVRQEVENAIADIQRDLFLRYLDRRRQVFGMGKTLAGAAADLVLPGIGVAVDLTERVGEIRAAGKLRWQGFLVSLTHKEK